METFTLIVSETNTYTIEVDAENEDQAVDIAVHLVHTNWDYISSHWTDGSFEVEVL